MMHVGGRHYIAVTKFCTHNLNSLTCDSHIYNPFMSPEAAAKLFPVIENDLLIYWANMNIASKINSLVPLNTMVLTAKQLIFIPVLFR